MKAIYHSPPLLCVVIETLGDGVILEPVEGDSDQRFVAEFSDPSLILDPTDSQVEACESMSIDGKEEVWDRTLKAWKYEDPSAAAALLDRADYADNEEEYDDEDESDPF